MNHSIQSAGMARRNFLRLGAFVAATAMLPAKLLAAMMRPADAFTATGLDSTFAQIGGIPELHDGIIFSTPDIAENGAVVPVKVEIDGNKLPKVDTIYVMVEKNPNPLSAMFNVPAGTKPYVETRVKVAQTCNLYAVVDVDGKLYMAAKETKVTLGGCGG